MLSIRSNVGDAISKLCKHLSEKAVKSFAIEWLYILPLYHILSGKVEFCGKPNFDVNLNFKVYGPFLGIMNMKKKADKEVG